MAYTVIAKPQKTLEKQANPAKRQSRAGVTESRHGNGAVPNQWKTLGKQRYLQAPRALPANGRGQKEIGDTVIANPRKTLEKQANPAKRQRTDVGKKNRLHGYRTSANRWKPLGNMVSLMVPMFCGASADLTGSRGCLPWNVIKSAESPKTLSCSQSLAMLYGIRISQVPNPTASFSTFSFG